MLIHISPEFFKKPTKLGLIGLILGGVLGLLFVWLVLYLKDQFPIFKNIIDINEDIVQLIFLLGASLIVGIAYFVGKAYRKYIKGVPKCLGCFNELKRYSLDLIEEKIKCKSCGFQATFYQFSDKIFLHDKFTEMLKDKNLDPIIIEKAQQLAAKFENFEFSKKK